MRLDLILRGILDSVIRENFQKIQDFLNQLPLLAGDFRFFETAVPPGARMPIKHGLSFVPKDIILTSIVGDQNVYFNYMDFDQTNIYVTSEGYCTLRFFAGSYRSAGYGKGRPLEENRFRAPGIVVDGGNASGS